MKSLILSLFLTIVGLETWACEWVACPVQIVQPVPVLQLQVYQAPAYTVMVPVVVQPQPVVQQRVVWGYPYQSVIVPVDQYYYWGYDRQCRLINRY